ncbi:MAG: MFS transporter [Sulfolobales archaeon]
MWRIFYSIAATLNTITWGVYFSFTRRYIGVDLGGGIHALLLLTGLEWLYVLFALVAARFSRSIGKRNSVLAGALGSVPLAISITLRDPTSLALILSTTSLAWAITWPLVVTAVFSGTNAKFGKVYSLFTIGTGFGYSVGSSIMGLLHYVGGPKLVFAFCSILHVATYTIFYAFYPKSEDTEPARDPVPKVPWMRNLGCVFTAYTLLVFCREAYYTVAPIKLSMEISRIMSETSVESQYIAFGILYGGLTAFLSIPARLAVGYLVDRYEPWMLIATSFALYTASYWLFISLEGIASIFVWQLPLYPVVDTSINVLLAKSSSGDSRTHALGAGLAFSAIGGLGVLPLIAHPHIDPISIGTLITLSALLGLVITAYRLALRRSRSY